MLKNWIVDVKSWTFDYLTFAHLVDFYPTWRILAQS